MAIEIELYFIRGAELVDEPDALLLSAPRVAHRAPFRLEGATAGIRSAFARLAGGGASLQWLVTSVLTSDGVAGAGVLKQAVDKLDRNGMLCRRLLVDGSPLAALEPRSTLYRHADNAIEATQAYALSRFASCRREGDGMMLSSPLGYADVLLHSATASAALFELAQPVDAAALAAAVDGLDEDAAGALLNLFGNAKAIVARDQDGADVEDEDPVLAQWEPEDLLFHAHSRLGRHSNPYGGANLFEGKFEALPIVKPPMSEDVTSLYKPDLAALRSSDDSFTEVLETRKSNRDQGEDPITVRQLGEFLYRTARVKHLAPGAGVSFRPSPGGGALHELEIYPLVSRCEGLDPGLYHYNPLDHNLCKVAEPSQYLAALARMAAIAGTLDESPQVVLIIAARFQRIQLKYRSMTYAAILKNVGGLFQTMYLVATAMRLAPCALGGGDSDIFSIAAGLDYLAETSVGEFMIGSAAPGSHEKTSWEVAAEAAAGRKPDVD